MNYLVGAIYLLGGGMAGTAVVYFASVETFWQVIKHDALSLTAKEEVWKELSTLKNKTNISNLKEWCATKYSQIFKHLFMEPDYENLKEIEANCIYPIKSKMKEQVIDVEIKDSEDTEKKIQANRHIIYNSQKIKDYTGEEGKPKLTLKLQKIKEVSDETERKWQIYSWCMSGYERGYKSERDNFYMAVKEFCSQKIENS